MRQYKELNIVIPVYEEDTREFLEEFIYDLINEVNDRGFSINKVKLDNQNLFLLEKGFITQEEMREDNQEAYI